MPYRHVDITYDTSLRIVSKRYSGRKDLLVLRNAVFVISKHTRLHPEPNGETFASF